MSATFGFASCDKHVLLTADSRTWVDVTPTGLAAPIHDVVFLDRLHGWIVTNDCAAARASVYRTSDGGRDWAAAPVGATNCAAGSRLATTFVDRRHGWLTRIFENGSSENLEITTDGGASWRPEGDLPVIGQVVLRTARDGWLAPSDFARAQQLYRTRDGGRTWHRRVLPPPRGWRGSEVFADTPVFFGILGVLPVDLAGRGRSGLAFYVTSNGGDTWRLRDVRNLETQLSPASAVFVRWIPVAVASETEWWVVGGGDARTLRLTEDGGRHWHASHPRALPRATSASVTAIDARRVWLTQWTDVGATLRTAIFATEDGGLTWSRLEPR